MNDSQRDKKIVDIIFAIFFGLVLLGIVISIIQRTNNRTNIFTYQEKRCKEKLKESELILANAIYSNNTRNLKWLLETNKNIIDNSYSGERYYSILHYAVDTQKYEATEQLLKSGYNPNIQDSCGQTPLYNASDFFDIYLLYRKEIDNISCFVDLLLDFNADPDIADNLLDTPLINTPTGGDDFSIQRLLVEKGKCNINLTNKDKHSAAYYALKYEKIYLAHFLIVEHKADLVKETFVPAYLLRTFVYPLDSKEYKLKLDIIEEFKRQGVDYYDTVIPDEVLERIKEIYPDTWEEYIKIY
ncbi:ankyrin repeat domain-containing protein [Treponema sp.]|uniref:ankyrin repeat domain-containing protein n=1 Tax=Treponema sp. TaxID=166 RepID=UPI00298DFF00|nr:ankyrin repeat domain-containing protein [Treponema sp.]MCR5613648.1 ankyrin repeat domain-containing protein [Treponema sp.]